MPTANGYVLAFDYGLRYIGVASGQTVTRTATPLVTLKARDGRPEWSALLAIVSEWGPVALLVGLPLNMDDSESEMCERARAFAESLARRAALPVYLVDERLSSVAAREIDPRDSHGIAAALIAETWLSSQPPAQFSDDI